MVAPNDSDFDYSSTTVPDGALFVAADEPLLVFPSVVAAERYLEAIDVQMGVYPAAYGPNGEPYRLDTDGNTVVIERTGEPNKPDALKMLLSNYLVALGRAPDPEAPLDDLLASVWAHESEFWRAHDPHGDRFGTSIPLWGCLAIIVALATGIYLALG